MKAPQWGFGMKTYTGRAILCTAVCYLVLATFTSLLSSPLSDLAGPLSCSMSSASRTMSNVSVISHQLEQSPEPELQQLSDSELLPIPDQELLHSTPEPELHPIPLTFVPAVQQLIDDLRNARAVAEAGELRSYSQEEKDAWDRDNPCQARAELPRLYASRRVAPDARPNPEWDAVFAEYTNLHRACMRKIKDITDVFKSRRIVPGCKFVTAESLFGLGNRITYAASVVLYAVLTKRVILLPRGTAPSIVCEPFEGSRWTLPYELEYLNRRKNENWVNVEGHSNGTAEFLDWMDEAKGDLASVTGQEYFHAEADDGWQPIDRFFCHSEQQFLAKAEWMSAAGCLYFVPKLYAIPTFRKVLEGLFPAPGLTTTYVLRSAFLPNDETWERVQRVYEMHLEKADRRVGIQSRYRWGQEQHEKMGSTVNGHISRCLQENGILPNVTESFGGRIGSPPFPIVKVMITSLYTDLHEHLSNIYLRHHTVTGESVGLVQLTYDREQRFTKEVDTQALVEIICLSLSDEILVTPLSTFGGVAQAYGALRPWIIEFDDSAEGSCSRSPSVDMCYQEVHQMLKCPYEPSVNGTNVMDAVPYVGKCSHLDAQNGILLVST